MAWSQDNILVIKEAKAPQKGGGVSAILGLMQDLLAFKEKVGATADAQEMAEIKSKLEQLGSNLDSAYETLIGIAKGGVQSIRQPEEGRMAESHQPELSDPNRIESF